MLKYLFLYFTTGSTKLLGGARASGLSKSSKKGRTTKDKSSIENQPGIGNFFSKFSREKRYLQLIIIELVVVNAVTMITLMAGVDVCSIYTILNTNVNQLFFIHVRH
jgi:hypothetical protein